MLDSYKDNNIQTEFWNPKPKGLGFILINYQTGKEKC